MPEPFVVNKTKTAVLCMDVQSDIVSFHPSVQKTGMLKRAAAVMDAARRNGVPVIHIAVRFREGYPEIHPRNKIQRGVKQSGVLKEGSRGGDFHPDVAPMPGDIVITRRRVSAFSASDLNAVLSAKGTETIVLMGIATSGVVLSTVRQAADADYDIVVLSDCCADSDPDVQRVLLEKVFPRQATVMTSAEFLKTIGA